MKGPSLLLQLSPLLFLVLFSMISSVKGSLSWTNINRNEINEYGEEESEQESSEQKHHPYPQRQRDEPVEARTRGLMTYTRFVDSSVAFTPVTISSSNKNIVPQNDVPISYASKCTYEPTTFNAEVIIDFLGFPENITTSQLELLADEFKDAFNEIAKSMCDESFRTIQSVKIDPMIVAFTQDNMNRRDLQQQERPRQRFSYRVFVTGYCRDCDVNTVRLFDDEKVFIKNEGARHRVLTQTGYVDRQHQQQQKHQRDLVDTESRSARFDGYVVYNRIRDYPDIFDRWSKGPFSCDCILTGEGDNRAVRPGEMNDNFNARIQSIRAQSNLDKDLTSLSMSQVRSFACPPALFDEFQSFVMVEATGDPDRISPEELFKMENLFLASYSSATQDLCDPELRLVTDATVEIIYLDQQNRNLKMNTPGAAMDAFNSFDFEAMVSDIKKGNNVPVKGDSNNGSPTRTPALPPSVNSSPRFRPFRFRFKVTGQCTDCRSDALLFNDGFRRQLEGSHDQPQSSFAQKLNRDLGYVLNDDTCFCVVGAPERTPKTNAFTEILNTKVQESASVLPSVGAITNTIQEDDTLPSSAPSTLPSIPFPSTTPTQFPTSSPTIRASSAPSVTKSELPSMSSNAPTRPTIPTESPVPSPQPSTLPTARPR